MGLMWHGHDQCNCRIGNIILIILILEIGYCGCHCIRHIGIGFFILLIYILLMYTGSRMGGKEVQSPVAVRLMAMGV